MSHPYTDEFGFPLTASEAAQWKLSRIEVAGFDYERGDRRSSAVSMKATAPGDALRPTILAKAKPRTEPDTDGGGK